MTHNIVVHDRDHLKKIQNPYCTCNLQSYYICILYQYVFGINTRSDSYLKSDIIKIHVKQCSLYKSIMCIQSYLLFGCDNLLITHCSICSTSISSNVHFIFIRQLTEGTSSYLLTCEWIHL